MTTPNSLLEQIQYLHDDKETGTLVLGLDDAVVEVHFEDGLISAVSSDNPRYQLGKFLARGGFAPETGIGDLIAEARKRGKLLGEVAVGRQLLDENELLDILQDQAIQLLSHALQNNFEMRDFTRSSGSLYLPVRMSLAQLALELARKNLSPFKLDAHKCVVLQNGHDLSDLSWYPQELSVLSELKSPKTLQELALATGLEYARLSRILSVLDALHLIVAVETPPAETTAVTRREGLPLDSLVPEIRNPRLNEKLEVSHNESSFVSEQFKTLKIRIGELAAARPIKVIAVSSPDKEDGKSLTCANLALCFSQDPGRRVLLMDCDLRKPSLHKYFGISLEPGLHGYLGTDNLQPYCYMRRIDRLFILTAGGTAYNPVELLSHEKMRRLIECVSRDFDTVIIDSPPLAPISDAQILAGLSDGLLVVVRSARTTYSSLERAFRNLDRQKFLGVVLNDVKPRLFHTRYDYKYYHYKSRDIYPYGKSRTRIRPKTYLEQ